TYVSEKIGALPGEEREERGEGGDLKTRGVQISTADDLIRYHKDYKVLATVDNGSNYFGWVNARNSGSDKNIWTTDRVEYWPGDKVVDFYAVSPSSEFSNLQNLQVSTGRISFKYALTSKGDNRDAEAQQDLLLSSSSCNKSGSINGRAPLMFTHALSAVKFAIRDVANGEIENIKISGVKTQGECRYVWDALSEKGSVSWSSLSGNGEFSQNFNYKVSGLGAVDKTDENADIVLNNTMPEKTFMMIPQDIPADAEIIVTVKRTGMTPERIEVRGKIRANDIKEWKAGHEYVYTISTSKSNWVYVLEAFGNRNSSTGEYGVTNGDQIYGYSPSAVVLDAGGRVQSYPHDKYGDNADFYVRSFRYHANDPSKREVVAWKATHGEGKQYRVISSREEYVAGRDLSAAEWIPTRDALSGSGSYDAKGEKKTITFATHHQVTDWPGDIWMQKQSAYSGNSESAPWDLSTANGSRNTANSYVIDREGWYCFPLVYGNAIKNGADNKKAYQYQGSTDANNKNFVTHSGTAITSPWITMSASYKAEIVWTDVYNAVSDVQLRTINGVNMILFRANKFNMQQGSVVIGLYSGSTAIWSWHIWISEHWLDHTTGRSNAYKSNGSFSTNEKSSSGWRQRGDVLINNRYVSSTLGYYISPYNLGWCDPKNVDYLRRPSTMTFTQYDASGKETGKKATLKILQDGERVEYKFGNNTYYQWGRKDPIVGFVDHSQTVKRNFGPKKYALV
ncbi:MAG: fimbrillin family protein, partial [Muribaculaceae bacterium]|nr:fimbrillin family protein [Muribaculaceae bacterium]